MRVGITGAYGFLGFHLRAYFKSKSNVELILAGRDVFNDALEINEFVSKCEIIVHLAGANRGDDKELSQINISLAEKLTKACEVVNVTPHVIYANTSHVDRDTSYGQSKRKAGEVFKTWATKHGANFANLIIPNVFGQFGLPFYNSAVSTFCYQIANNQSPTIIIDTEIELIHAQQVAQYVENVMVSHHSGDFRLSGTKIRVTELLARLREMAILYTDEFLLPDLRDVFDLDLFNTYRSYLFPNVYPVSLKVHTDERGELFEAVRSLNGGQVFVSTTFPEVTRGNHYHRSKVERFLIVKGDAVIQLRKLFDTHVFEFYVSGQSPQYIDIPTFFTHNIKNIGQDQLLTMFWSHEIFDPNNSDTYQEQV